MSLEERIAEVVRVAVRAELAPLRQEIERLRGGGRATLSKRAAARMLGIDRNKTLAALIADGQIGTVEIRGRVCIPRAEVDRILAAGAPTPAVETRRRPGSAAGATALRSLRLDEL